MADKTLVYWSRTTKSANIFYYQVFCAIGYSPYRRTRHDYTTLRKSTCTSDKPHLVVIDDVDGVDVTTDHVQVSLFHRLLQSFTQRLPLCGVDLGCGNDRCSYKRDIRTPTSNTHTLLEYSSIIIWANDMLHIFNLTNIILSNCLPAK